jgi:hypothetical protein
MIFHYSLLLNQMCEYVDETLPKISMTHNSYFSKDLFGNNLNIIKRLIIQ